MKGSPSKRCIPLPEPRVRASRVSQSLLVVSAISLFWGAPAQPVDTRVPESTRPAAASERRHEFTFARAIYSDVRMGWGRRGGSWATDYPEADQHILIVLQRLVDIDAYPADKPVRLDDPEVRRFPFLYAVEVGRMQLTDAEVEGLRDYLLAGGFLFVDDFWGTREWWQFESQIRRVFPDRAIVDLPLDHELLTTFYRIDEIVQVPNIYNARRGGPTWERDGYEPALRAIFDDEGRIMVLISWNSDLGDAWEWADNPYYPLEYSTYAFEIAANAIVYAMSR